MSKLQRLALDLRAAQMGRKMLLPVLLPGALRTYFATRLEPDESRASIRRSLEAREDRFLRLCESEVFKRPDSPYLQLFRSAGCEQGDLQAGLTRDGLDATLVRLARAGIYLSADEFKGKCDVQRGEVSFRVAPRDLQPRGASPGLPTESSGSTSQPLRSLSSIEWLAAESHATRLFLEAHGLESHAHAALDVILSGAAGMAFLLMLARAGIRPDRWFCRRLHHTWPERFYQSFVAAQVRWAAERWGPGFPAPEFLDPPDVRPVVRWVAERAGEGERCCIRCVGSNAVRIARSAIEMGVSLGSVTFVVSGEPFTEAKRRAVENSGAGFAVMYGYTPGVVHVGRGCPRRHFTDEMHVDLSTLAVVDHDRRTESGADSVRPLLFTTLLPSAAMLQINVENGDYAVIERRNCGCPMGEAGLDLLIHRVRSFEKFTCQGMNYSFGDLYQLVEDFLPRQLGGGPGDYQLVEEGAADGEVFLTLRIDPDVGVVEEDKALRSLLEGLSIGSRSQRLMARVWSETGALRIRRERPVASARGKVAPFVLRSG